MARPRSVTPDISGSWHVVVGPPDRDLGTLQVDPNNSSGMMIIPGSLCPTVTSASIRFATLFSPTAYIYTTVNGSAATLIGTFSRSTIIGQYTSGTKFISNFIAQKITAPSLKSIKNAASYSTSVSPGSVTTLFGEGLAAAISSATTIPLPISLSNATLCIGAYHAPLWYASPSQVNFQLPAEATAGIVNAVLTAGGVTVAQPFTVASVAPGIFTYANNRAIAVNPNSTLTDSANQAIIGSTITVYLTGVGPLDNRVLTNTLAPVTPLSNAVLPATATIGDIHATIQFLGLVPGAIGLAQANLVVPELAPGDYPVVITVGGIASNAPVISVGSN